MKPSVSNLIDLLDKPGLLKWANKIGLEGVKLDDYRSKAKESGSDIHEQVSNFLKFRIPAEDTGLQEKITKFFSDKHVIVNEWPIETDDFIGRFDIKFEWKDIIWVADFKSNSKVYLETKLQLAAYKMAEPCDHVAVIHLPEFQIQPISLDESHFEFVKKLAELYQIKHRLENNK